MSDVISSTFETTRDDYSASQKLARTLLLILLFLHITTFSQYLQTSSNLHESASEAARTAKAKDSFDTLATRTEAFRKSVDQGITETFDAGFVNQLRLDFARLSKELDPQATHEPQNLQVQAVIQEPMSSLLTPEELEGVRNLDRKSMVKKLVDPVRRIILIPRFNELEANWKKRAALIESEGKTVVETANNASQIVADERTKLIEITMATERVTAAAHDLKIDIPEGDWWGSVGGKEVAVGLLRQDALATLADDVSGKLAGELRRQSEALNQSALALKSALEAKLERVKTQFESQQQQAATLAKPLSFLTIDVKYFATRFPALLGLAIGLSMLWLAERRARLASAYQLAAEQDPSLKLLSRVFNFGPASSGKRIAILKAIGGATWVAIASIQLAISQLVSGEENLTLFAAGLLPVIVAMIYEVSTIRRVDVA